jgi:hypothetical protein
MNRADEEAARMLAEEQSARKTLAMDRVATDERSHGATTLIGGQNFMLAPGAVGAAVQWPDRAARI